MFFHILSYKLRSFLKTAFDTRTVSIVRGLGTLLVYAGFSYGAYQLSYGTTKFILEQTRIGLYLYHTFISMMLFVFFIAVNLGNIIVSYSTLYRSPEVMFLLTKPVKYSTIFSLKFLDNFFYSSTTLFLVGFMVLLGYGNYLGHPWYFFAGTMIFLLLPFMFLSACLAVLVLMAIMKLAGQIGFRRVMAALFAFYFFLIFLFFKGANPITLVEKINRYYPNVDQYISSSLPPFLHYLPNQWIADFLYYIARGEIVTGLSFAGILIGVTAVAFSACFIIAKKFYYKSWLVSLKVQSAALQPYDPAKRIFMDFRSISLLQPQSEVLWKKEFFLFFREPSQWIHFVVMLIMIGLYTISVSHLNLYLRVLDVQLLTYLVLFAFGGFMINSLSLRFVFPMIGLEGRAFWTLRTSPVKAGKILWLKFLFGFVPVFILAEYIAVATNIPFVRLTEMRPLLLWFGIFSAFWMSLTTVLLNLGLGGYFANYLERNPIRAASTQGATLTFLATLGYLIIMVVIILLPVSEYFTMLYRFKNFNPSMIIIPGTIFAVISYLLAVGGILVGFRSLKRDF